MMPPAKVEAPLRRAATEDVPWWRLFAAIVPAVLLASATLGIIWLIKRRPFRSTGSSEIMSPDTVSSLFPDRPIRPLPKRRLRERLSPDVAESIQYPPAPASTTPLFLYPYNGKDDEHESLSAVHRERDPPSLEGGHNHRTGGSEEDDSGLSIAAPVRSSPNATGRAVRQGKQEHPRYSTVHMHPSAASSADSYDAFENTNNKKKRKIPTAGDISLIGGHSVNDLISANSGNTLTSPDEGHGEGSGHASSAYYGSNSLASGSSGISGPGRGRYGRARNGRSPLRALSDASSNWAGRNGKLRPTQWASPQTENTGIISSAIANAHADKVPSSQGQENVSLLQQQQSTKSSPTSSQFTFTCDSQVPGNLTWPGADPKTPSLPLHQQGQSAPAHWQQGRTRSDQPAAQPGVPNMGNTNSTLGGSNTSPKGTQQPEQDGKMTKKARAKQLRKEIKSQIRVRQQKQEIENYRNPPGDDIYICAFCEFEALVGKPPRFLIRKFEIKERKKRLDAERLQRLRDKAKARSRKGKKGKAPAKGSGPPDHPPQPGQQAPPMNADPSDDIRSDEYDEEEDFDDGQGPDDSQFQHAPTDREPIAKTSTSGAGGGPQVLPDV